MGVLPLSALFFMALKGFVYAISVDFYAFRLAFSSIQYSILVHFTLRFGAFYLAFWCKTHCV